METVTANRWGRPFLATPLKVRGSRLSALTTLNLAPGSRFRSASRPYMVAVQLRRPGQGGEAVDELQRGEGQRGAPVALWLRQTISDPVFVDLFDPLKGERRARAVAP